jgi:hypothetical protein
MNAVALRANHFEPSFRRRLALFVQVLAPVEPVSDLTTEEFFARRRSEGSLARLTHLPSSGLTL